MASLQIPTKTTVPRNSIPNFVWWVLFLSAPLLLLLGGVGIFRLFAWAAERQSIDPKELTDGLLLAILPILLFAFLSSAVAVNYVRHRARYATNTALVGLQNRQNYHQDFMRIIADNRPGATMIIDGEGRLWFMNAQAAAVINIAPQDAVGLSFEKIFPEAYVQRLMPVIRKARSQGTAAEVVTKVKLGNTHFLKSEAIPLPVTANMHNAVMVNEDDITNLLVEREARERMFRQVIDTLVAVVDRRDPFAAGHSARVGQIAKAIATEMKLDAVQIETAEIAGLLMNFGKVLVPREILIKTTALSIDELKQVHQSLLTSADILALIGFSQPVVPTLRQVLEHYDGTGVPGALRGDAIMQTARVVAVANAFVALLSARAHRPGFDVAGAIAALLQQADQLYDRRVVTALTTCVEAQHHALEWLPATLIKN